MLSLEQKKPMKHQNKKVLVICTGNSCRSIIAEALINKYLNIAAKSAGSSPKGEVNPNAVKILKKLDAWDERYYSKPIDEVKNENFDLVITVCNGAKESCPYFAGAKNIHIPFEDPDGKDFEAFEKTAKEIKEVLLTKIKEELSL